MPRRHRRYRLASLALAAMIGTLVSACAERDQPTPSNTPKPLPQSGVSEAETMAVEASGRNLVQPSGKDGNEYRSSRGLEENADGGDKAHHQPKEVREKQSTFSQTRSMPRNKQSARRGGNERRKPAAAEHRDPAASLKSAQANEKENLAAKTVTKPKKTPEEPQAPTEQRALLQLFVNTEEKGEVVAILRDGDVLIQAEELRKSGIQIPLSKDDSEFVSLSELQSQIAYEVDEEELALHLAAKPELFGTQVIDLRRRAPENIEYADDASVYLNYATRVTNSREVDLFLELGASAGSSSVYSSVMGLWHNGFHRGLTNYTFDDRSTLNRIVVGDSFVTTGALGGGAYLGGLTLMRSFELDPYLVRTPSFDLVDATSTPSTLEVYVNDTLVRRETIAPGTFQLSHLSAPAGAGATRYVIRDAFGYEQQVTSEYYVSQGLLAKGLSDYAFSVGMRRNRIGLDSFDYRDPGFLLRHRVGLSQQVTLGFRGEASEGLLSGGSNLTLGTLAGQLDFALSASTAHQENGFAGLVAHTYTTRNAGISTTFRVASDRYSTLSTSPWDDRDLLQGAISGSLALTRNLTTSLQHSAAKSRDFGLHQRTSVRSRMRLSKELALSITANHWMAEQAPGRVEGFVGLSWAPGNSVHASATAHVANDASEGIFDVHKPLPTGTGYGYRANVATGDRERVHAFVQSQESYGRYAASFDRVDGQDRATVEASGSIVAVAGGGVFLSRPVRQGFAVVHVPDAPNVRGYLENREVGRTNSNGKLLVPDLQPYYGNRISVADPDLPPDIGIEETERVIAPPYRGGAVVRFRARSYRYFRGKVVMVRGEEKIVPTFGEMSVEIAGRTERLPLGRQGELELEGAEQGSYAFTVEHEGALCRGSLEIPHSEDLIGNLGEVRCELVANAPKGNGQ